MGTGNFTALDFIAGRGNSFRLLSQNLFLFLFVAHGAKFILQRPLLDILRYWCDRLH
jgi:hypothetical protein